MNKVFTFCNTAFIALIVAIVLGVADASASELSSRYFHTGDGKISITGPGGSFSGLYRKANGTPIEAAMKAINRAFGATYGDPATTVSNRLIEFLDFLEDHFHQGARITIVSGYRSPTYNTKLRENGKLAAKASLHQYGMAADLKISGVSSKEIWNFIRDLKFGGVGFYHGGLVHVDVGPARFWDERTSGVGTDISDDNKLIDIVADRDIYLSGEEIALRLTRMTAFPIGISPSFTLEVKTPDGGWKKRETFEPLPSVPDSHACPKFSNIAQMANFKWRLPTNATPGSYRVRATFCESPWPDMPESITTAEFEVR